MAELTRRHLDALAGHKCREARCPQDGGCAVYLTPLCHPGGAVKARYEPPTGLLCLDCAACGKWFAAIRAEEER